MSIVAELEVPSMEFVLGDSLRSLPEMQVEFERIVTHSQEWIMPFLWAWGPNVNRFKRAVERDPTVSATEVADRFDDDTALFQIEWDIKIKEIVNGVFDKSGALVKAVGKSDSWDLVVRFEDRNSLSELQRYFEDGDHNFVLNRIYTPETPSHPAFTLTREQRETLTTAVEQGYFEVPRQTSLERIAEVRGVSTTATSECLRRAVDALTQNTLLCGHMHTDDSI